jgi:hypothetical protein
MALGMTVKWVALSAALVIVALTVVANLLAAILLRRNVPDLANLLAAVLACTAAVTAYLAHLYGRINAKLDLAIELLVGRFEELENLIGTPKDE